jgi:hypothetical protein
MVLEDVKVKNSFRDWHFREDTGKNVGFDFISKLD